MSFDKARKSGEMNCHEYAGVGVKRPDCMHRRMPPWLMVAALAIFLRAGVGVAHAGMIEPYTPADRPFWALDEVRAGFFKQAIDDAPHEGGPALNLEVLGGRLPGGYENSILNYLLTPRPHLGTTLAFGKTDEFYWGVTWDAKLFDRTFFEASFGGAAHDGPINMLNHASYGCVVNFRESASLGYEIMPHWRVMAIIDHMSNAGLCNPNPNRGLTNAGIRLGYRW
jgi:lipid A 3-O-deacylase